MRAILALSFVQRALMLAIYVGSTMILARLLTPAQVGIFSMTAAFVGIAAVVREFGISEYLVQEREIDQGKIRAAYGVAIVMGWTVGTLVFVLTPILAAIYGEDEVRRIGFVLCLNFLLLPFATPSMAMLVREMALAKAWSVQTAGVAVQYAVSIYLAWKGMGPISLAWGSVASSLVSVVLLNVLRPTEIRLLPTLTGSQSAWSYGYKFTLSSGLEVAAKNAHEFILPRAFGFAALGLYSRAAGLFEQFNQNFTRAISRVLVPSIAQNAREGSTDLARRYGNATAHYTCVAWSFFAFVAVSAPELVLVLFGDQWMAAVPLLQLMCIAGVIQAGYGFASDVLAGLGQIGAKLRIISVASPAWVLLCIAGSLVSVQAIALLSAGPALIALYLYSRKLNKLIGFSLADLLRSTAKSAVVASIVAASLLSFVEASNGSSRLHVLQLFLLGCAASAAWLAAVFALRHPIGHEIRSLANRITRLAS